MERRLAEIPPDWPEPDYAEALKFESYGLRRKYRDLIDEAVAHHRPVPPPFPER